MLQDAPLNSGAPDPALEGPWSRAAGMQAKLHRWAAADPGRRFDDLFNLVHDPATLIVAFSRVAGNKGANTPGVDGITAEYVEKEVGAPGFLDDLRAALKDGSFRPLPVRERMIPKPGGSGKLRRLGIPAIADRVVQAALKLVLEPVFEADFEPVSYGFRPAVAKNAFAMLDNFAWWRVIRMLMVRHRWRWKDVRRRFTDPSGRWLPVTAGCAELRHIAAIPVTRYRYRGSQIPNPWAAEPA